MKFKKVEISAFRIFDKPEDATFDFTNKAGGTANFISLYAPNGFGKTSFYDAVEWGVTNNIERFWKNKKTDESINTLRDLNQKQVQFITRTDSKKENTFVKITPDTGELVLRNLKVHGRSRADLNENDKIENKGFRQVLLSQEWVAAFLQEKDGELRYGEFMENPDLQEVDNYYKGVKSLERLYKKTIDDLQSEIEGAKQSIQGNDNSDLLETINSHISTIVEKYGEHNLKLIALSTTQEQIKDLRDLISNQIITCNREAELTENLNSITMVKIGDGKIVGANVFFEATQFSEKAIKELEKIRINLDRFDKLEKSSNELINNQRLRKQLSEEKEQLDKIISQFANYQQVKKKIDKKSKLLKKIELGLSGLSTQAEKLAKNEITQKNQRDTFIKQIEGIKNKKATLPELEQRIETSNINIQRAKLFLDKAKTKIERKENAIKKSDNNVYKFRKIIEKTNIGQYPTPLAIGYPDFDMKLIELMAKNTGISLEEKKRKETNADPTLYQLANNCPGFADIQMELKAKNERIHSLKLKLKELNLKIDQQQTLNSTIEEFIKSGLSIVNERQDSTCPLCENTYASYTQLAQRISNNKALNNNLKGLLSERSTASQRIAALTEEIKKGNKILTDFYSKQIDELLVKKQELSQVLGRQKNEISNKEDDLKKLKQRMSEYNIELNGLPLEKYKKQLEVSLKETIKRWDASAKLLSTITNETASMDEKIKNQKAQRNLIEKEIQKTEINEKYVFVVTWCKDNYPNHSIDKNILTDRNLILTEKIIATSTKISELETVIETLKRDLSSITQGGVLSKQKEWEIKKQEADGKVANYTHFLKDKLKINLGQANEKSLLKLLNEREKEYKSQLKTSKDLREEYQKLEKYSENLLPFLQSENAKIELKEKEKEIALLNEKIKPLIEKEKEKTKNHLQDKVKDYFNEDLINDLYRKIDPHPDFKSMEFRANFDNEYPTLDVFVKDSNNKRILIPNLYFSHAQINILSLSIFLASALNSKEYDCIFIDDPIQSLDSINVLSTIDLLRSIVVNQDKQIILSTHDENFHNLLKKKIPDNLFNSKFLELETFGKVKKEI